MEEEKEDQTRELENTQKAPGAGVVAWGDSGKKCGAGDMLGKDEL